MTPIPKWAVEKSIEGGWQPIDYWVSFSCRYSGLDFVTRKTPKRNRGICLDWEKIILDPEFWKCLGKSLGHPIAIGNEMSEVPYWSMVAHRFFDLILTNQPTDKFWGELKQ